MSSRVAKKHKRKLHSKKYNNKINTKEDTNKYVYDRMLLLRAVDNGDVHEVTNIISLGRDSQIYKNIALNKASDLGYFDIVELLIEYGANVNDNRGYALRVSASRRNTDICILLIKHGCDTKTNWNDVMFSAIQNEDIKLIKYITQCERPPRMRRQDIWGKAICTRNLVIIKLVIEEVGLSINYNEGYPLTTTCALGDKYIDVIKYLVDNGADLRINFDYILRHSITEEHYKIQEYLISHGEGLYVGPKTIIAAAESNNIRMVDYLVNKGVDIEPIKEYPIYFKYKHNMYGKLERTSGIIDNSEKVYKRHYDCGISDKYPQLTDYEYNILSSMQMVLDLRDNMYLNII